MESELDGVLFLQLPDAVLLDRILVRRRADDTEGVIRQRLVVYKRQTQPLVEYYKQRGKLTAIDGDRLIEEVAGAFLEALGRKVNA